MHCAQARNLIALLVGDDIGDTDRPKVESHLSQCESCKGYHSELQGTQQQLQMLSAEDSAVLSTSLWPDLQPTVRLANQNRGKRQFNGWVAALAVAAMVMAMFAMSGDFVGPIQHDDGGSGIAPLPVKWSAPGSNEVPELDRDVNSTDESQFGPEGRQ